MQDSVFYTIGHSSLELDKFLQLLHNASITCVADVRRLPGSNKFPHFNQQPLKKALAAAGIKYSYLQGLAGRRNKQAIDPDINKGWQQQSFHNYADYALLDDFQKDFALLLQLGKQYRVAIMCAEAVWWRCHRRIISDHLLAAGQQVVHIIGSKVEAAQMTPFARIRADGQVIYPGEFSA